MRPHCVGTGMGGLGGSAGSLATQRGLGREEPAAGGSPACLGPCSPSQPGAGPAAHHSESRGAGAEGAIRSVSGCLPALAERGKAGPTVRSWGRNGPGARPDGRLPLQDVILLGDFNADCASLTKKRLDELVLRTQAGFHWAVADGVDTTVRASTHCTYDRIVLHGERLQSLLRNAGAFDFPQSFGLTEEEVKG